MPWLGLQLTCLPRVALYPAGATFGPRQSRDWEFVWMIEGEADYTAWGGGPPLALALPQNTLLLCRPDREDAFVWDQQRRTRHGYIHFQLENTDPPESKNWPNTREAPPGGLLATLCRHLESLSAPHQAPQRLAAAQLLLTAFISGDLSLGELPGTSPPDPVQRALRFIENHVLNDCSQPLALDPIARAAFVSPEYLCRLFMASTGQTPLQTVRLARLERALELVTRSNYNFSEIARLCGFASPFHFSRAFKAVYALSPRAYRKSLVAGVTLPGLLAQNSPQD